MHERESKKHLSQEKQIKREVREIEKEPLPREQWHTHVPLFSGSNAKIHPRDVPLAARTKPSREVLNQYMHLYNVLIDAKMDEKYIKELKKAGATTRDLAEVFPHDILLLNMNLLSDDQEITERIIRKGLSSLNLQTLNKAIPAILNTGFPPQEVMETMEKNHGKAGIITCKEHLDAFLFAGYPPKELAEKMLYWKEHEALIPHLKKFPKGTLDVYTLLAELIAWGKTNIILEHLSTIPKEQVPWKDLAWELGTRGKILQITKHLDDIPEGIVNVHKLLSDLLVTGQGRFIAEYTEKFLAHGITHEEILDALEKNGLLTSIIPALHAFPVGSVPIEKIWKKIETGQISTHIVMDCIPELLRHGLTKEQLKILLEKGNINAILTHLDDFPEGTLDLEHLAERAHNMHALLCAQGRALLTHGLSSQKFLEYVKSRISFVENIHAILLEGCVWFDAGLIPEDVFDTCVRYESPERVFYYLKYFPNGSIPKKKIASVTKKMLEPMSTGIILENVEYLPLLPGQLNTLVITAYTKGEIHYVVPHIEHLLTHGMNTDMLAEKLIATEQHAQVAKFIKYFLNGKSEEDKKILKEKLTKAYQEDLLHVHTRNISMERGLLREIMHYRAIGVIDDEFDPNDSDTWYIKENITETPIGDLDEIVLQERFTLLAFIYKKRKDVVTKFMHEELTKEGVEKMIHVLQKDGRTKNADALTFLAQEVGWNFSLERTEEEKEATEKKKEVQEKMLTEMKKFVQEKYTLPQTIAHKEIAEFYVLNEIKYRIALLERTPDVYLHLPFADRLVLYTFLDRIKQKEKEITTWMRWYVLHACIHEMRHEGERGMPVFPSSADYLITFGSVGDILDFFTATIARFRYGVWQRNYGGELWAKIAEAGYALWATPEPSAVLIDHLFALEHNNGTIFDKAPRVITQDKRRTQEMLNKKFSSKNMEDALVSLKKGAQADTLNDILPKEFINKLHDDLLTLKDIEKRFATHTGVLQ